MGCVVLWVAWVGGYVGTWVRGWRGSKLDLGGVGSIGWRGCRRWRGLKFGRGWHVSKK